LGGGAGGGKSSTVLKEKARLGSVGVTSPIWQRRWPELGWAEGIDRNPIQGQECAAKSARG